MTLVVIILLILLLFGALPQTGWRDAGWAPSGGIGLILLIVLILFLLGYIR